MSDPGIQPTAPVPAPAPVAAPPTTAWLDSFDDTIKGFAANKGLDKLAINDAFKKVVESYQHAESRLGIPPERVLKLPAADSPQAEWDALYAKLGRPAKAEEYAFDVTDANDKNFAEAVRNFAHTEGLSKDKGEKLWKTLVEFGTKAQTAEDEASKAALTLENTELEKSWGKGSDFQAKKLVAMRAAKAAGVTEEQFEEAADKPGFSKAWNLFLFFGQKMGEDKFIPGGTSASNVYTREQALAEAAYYRDGNSEKGKALKANNPEAWANYRALLKIAHPEEQKAA